MRKCLKCNKDFKTKQAYERHANRVTPCVYKCNICDENFLSKRSLAYHNKERHINKGIAAEDKYPCKYCEKPLSTKFNLDRHYETCNVYNRSPDEWVTLMKEKDKMYEAALANNNTSINNTVNITNNIEVKIAVYGKETYTGVDFEKLGQLMINNLPDYIHLAIGEIYNNDNCPQNRNIYYDRETETLWFYSDTGWKRFRDVDKAVVQISNNVRKDQITKSSVNTIKSPELNHTYHQNYLKLMRYDAKLTENKEKICNAVSQTNPNVELLEQLEQI